MTPLEPLPTKKPRQVERIAYLDNARYWVMLLVVVGHCLTELVVMDSARGVYTWIYLFHMPFFVLISGFTARGYVGDHRQVSRIISTLIIPYLLVETALQLMTRYYDGVPDPLRILSPQWVGWFLAALFVWRLTTPIWRTLRYPITTAVVISLAAPLFEIPNVLALPKILGLLPFYVIGLHFSQERFLALGATQARRISAAVVLAGSFVGTLILAGPIGFRFSTTWLLWRDRYNEESLDVEPIIGIAIRAGLIVLALLLTFATLALIPTAWSWTTEFGERTLYAYLLHGFIIIFLDRQFGLWAAIEPYGAIAVVGAVVGGIVLANLLMTALIARIFRPIFEPKLSWMFRNPPTDRGHQ